MNYSCSTYSGVQLWRIDNKSQELSVVGTGSFGVFRSDDCYVLLEVR
jgi:hypothetical protein